MSISRWDGPIGVRFGKIMRWAHAADQRRYSHPELEPLMKRLYAKASNLRRLLGRGYAIDPMDPWTHDTVEGSHGNKFRRRLLRMPASRRAEFFARYAAQCAAARRYPSCWWMLTSPRVEDTRE